MCGGQLDIEPDSSVCECEYCGSKQTIPNTDDEKRLKLYERANRLRFDSEFDKAAGVYESIVGEYQEEAEAYWGLVLCKYGIEYVDDPATGKKIPTCHRSSFESVMDDSNFDLVMENADAVARSVYREEAKQIEEIRKGIIEVSSTEEPYDIFICYKETDDKGDRTIDSVIAQDVYNELTEKGYRVFFSRITLEDKLGQEYEPYIFAALNSAKVMLAFGTSYDYYNAVWVKNEWSRFLKLIAEGQKKTLIPCYKDIDAYDIPKEFKHLQAQDMGKVGAIQDLIRGIDKIFGKDKKIESSISASNEIVSTAGVLDAKNEAQLKRGFIALEDKDWKKADGFFEEVLNYNAECAEAYLGKLLVDLKIPKRQYLAGVHSLFDDNNNYLKIMRFGDDNLKAEMENYVEKTKINIDRDKADIYENAVKMMNAAKTEDEYIKASEQFDKISQFKDSDNLSQVCKNKAEEHKKNTIYSYAKNRMDTAKTIVEYTNAIAQFKLIDDWMDSKECIRICKEKITKYQELEKEEIYKKAIRYKDIDKYEEAVELFSKIRDYKDSKELIEDCYISQQQKEQFLRKSEAKDMVKRDIIIAIILIAVISFFILMMILMQ